MAAACILATLEREEIESDAEYTRAYVGALLFAEALGELRKIRQLLTAPEN